jgi:porin
MYGVDASLTADLQKLAGLQGGKIYVEGFYVGGKSLDENYVGAGEAPSALDAFQSNNVAKLYQLYYDQQFGGTNILIGKFDVQQQFGTTRPMDLFADKAQAMTMSYFTAGLVSANFPSVYPDTSVGLRIKQTFNDQWSVKAAVLNGEADSPDAAATSAVVFAPKYGVLGLGEVDYTPSKYTKLMAGVWTDTGQLTEWGHFTPTFAPVTTWGEVGEYVGAATRLYTIEGSRGIDGFFNLGASPSDTNFTDRSGDVGMTVTGLFEARPNDKMGIAFAIEHNSTDFKNFEGLFGTHLANYESLVEGTYRAKITDWLNLQPEVDYIWNPVLATPVKSAFAYGLHFELHRDFN